MRVERFVDLGDQLALAVAGAQLDGAVGFGRRAVGEVGMILVFFLQMLQRFLGFLENIFPPREQLRAEILALALVHERLFIGRPIVLGLGQHPTYSLVSFVFRRECRPLRAAGLYTATNRRTTSE